MVELAGVAVKHGRQLVLKSVDLRLDAGECVCLFGPSGCGKTTILDVVAGLRRPTAGTVTIDARRVGYAFQDDRLLPWRTVRENLVFGLSGTMRPAAVDDAVTSWLRIFDLEAAAAKLPGELSGGMRRRVNIARALAVSPDLLLLDEPFTFLDGSVVATVHREIMRLNREHGTTVLFVSHVLAHARGLEPVMLEITGAPIALNYAGGGRR